MSTRASSLLLATNHFYPPGAGLSARQLGGQRQVASRGKHKELAAFGLDRLEARHRAHHVAVAARADLALDVIEIRDHDLRLLGAVRAKDSGLVVSSAISVLLSVGNKRWSLSHLPTCRTAPFAFSPVRGGVANGDEPRSSSS